MSVLFDHRAGGTPERSWLASERLATCRVAVLPTTATKVVVLAAHPDDETLGAGGLIATAARSGIPIEVIIATDGEASHPGSLTHSPGQLATLRRIEAESALTMLAPGAELSFLGLPDGALDMHITLLAELLRPRVDPRTLLVTPWSGDRHPDHEACAQAAAEVAPLHGCGHWQYPIWAWHWADPDSAELPWPDLRRVEVDLAAAEAKRAAMAAYVSQHAPLSDVTGDEAILSAEVTAHFERPFEVFVVASAPASEARYFDALYSRADDPWGLQERFYEQRKRELLCAALPRARFRRAFEPGCATGLLTARLAARCDEVLACDVAERAVAQTRSRLADVPNVRVDLRRIPEDWPAGPFDLIVMSEVGYYCPDLGALAGRIRAELAPDGVVVGCHWRHDAPDHPHTAVDVHRAVGQGLHKVASHVEDDFLLEVWSRTGDSVARADGIVT